MPALLVLSFYFTSVTPSTDSLYVRSVGYNHKVLYLRRKPDGKKPLGKLDDDGKILKSNWKRELVRDSQLVGSCECYNENLGSTKGGDFIDILNDQRLLKNPEDFRWRRIGSSLDLCLYRITQQGTKLSGIRTRFRCSNHWRLVYGEGKLWSVIYDSTRRNQVNFQSISEPVLD